MGNAVFNIDNIAKVQEAHGDKLHCLFGLAFSILIILSSCIIIHHNQAGNASLAATQLAAAPVVSAVSSSTTQLSSNTQKTLALSELKPTVVTVKRKDTLSKIFARLGLSSQDAKRILALKSAQSLRSLSVGAKLNFYINRQEKSLKQLVYNINDTTTLTITHNNGFQPQLVHVEPITRLQYVASNVGSSVYATGKRIGLPSKIIQQFASVFNNKANFAHGIYRGDKIAVYYREYFVRDKKIRDGDIAAAELIHKNKKYRIIGFLEPSGKTSFYTPQGIGLVPPFLRYPVNFKRIGDRFSLARLEPILGIVRPHLGVDLIAPHGTPIKAASDGVITLAGRKGGYGNAITLQHGIYTTLYAHLSRFNHGIHPGAYVKQGQVIGFVGATGLATGPHLHYEFHINDVHVDPLKVKLPTGEMIASAYRSKFFAFSRQMLAKLDMQHNVRVAMQDDGSTKI